MIHYIICIYLKYFRAISIFDILTVIKKTPARQQNYSFKYNILFYDAAIIFLPIAMHLLPRMNVILYFIYVSVLELRGMRNEQKLQNEKLLSMEGFESITLE